MAVDETITFVLYDLQLAVPKALIEAVRPHVLASRPSLDKVHQRLDSEMMLAFGSISPDKAAVEDLDAGQVQAINGLVIILLALGETTHPGAEPARHLH
jgi:hypothetical protein